MEAIMKRLIMVGCLAVGLVAVLGISGNAQLTHRYSAKIPFDFSIRGKRLQAGDYTITTLSSVTNLRAVYLRDSSTGKGLVIGPAEVISSDSEERGALVFVRVDNGWVL